MQKLRAFLADESGSNVVEYALLGSIVTIIAIGSMIAMGAQVSVMLSDILAYL
ncbi:MAG: Flp family type IVb pilin [Proteobacteria bacterium]|nr:Flp family type IVb pilin [Pseudomonadota bacterium]